MEGPVGICEQGSQINLIKEEIVGTGLDEYKHKGRGGCSGEGTGKGGEEDG